MSSELDADELYEVVSRDMVLEVSGDGFTHEYELTEHGLRELAAITDTYDEQEDVTYMMRVDGGTVSLHGFEYEVNDFDEFVAYELFDKLWTHYKARGDELKSVQEKNDALLNDADDLRTARDQWKGRYNQAQDEITDLEDEVDELEEKITELEEELDEYREEEEEATETISSPYHRPKEEIAHITFDRVGGLDDQLERITEIIDDDDPFMENLRTQDGNEQSMNGIMLYGPPGTGKTFTAKAVANEYDYNLFIVKGPEIVDKYVGESEKKVRKLARTARKHAPSLIVFDEIDAIAAQRSGGGGGGTGVANRIVTQLLAEMDGFDDNDEVHVLATTNRLDRLDPALLRPGRFTTQVEYDMPTVEETYDIASRYFPAEQAEYVADTVTADDGFMTVNNGSMIKEVRDEAVRQFGKENSDRDGALIAELVADELERYANGDGGRFGTPEGFETLTTSMGRDEAESLLQETVASSLFTQRSDLAVLTEDMLDTAIELVYEPRAEQHRDRDGSIGFQ